MTAATHCAFSYLITTIAGVPPYPALLCTVELCESDPDSRLVYRPVFRRSAHRVCGWKRWESRKEHRWRTDVECRSPPAISENLLYGYGFHFSKHRAHHGSRRQNPAYTGWRSQLGYDPLQHRGGFAVDLHDKRHGRVYYRKQRNFAVNFGWG